VGDGEVDAHWFEAIADHTGAAYLRYSFTKGTNQEVDFLIDVLGLEKGMRVLDVGCGPGRHSHELARRGIDAHGVDISQRFIDVARDKAPPNATFERLDARTLAFDAEFDAVISLCQGAFGLLGGDQDIDLLSGMAHALKPDGRVAVSAFNAYFQVRYLEDSVFDAEHGVNHERTTVKDVDGKDADFDLWTTCFTPRELRLMAHAAGLEVEHLYSVGPGEYARREPSIDSYEYLLVAKRAN
jgi:cyclopropane fatty-acyl-phospholipid synthase-like methyltransferase